MIPNNICMLDFIVLTCVKPRSRMRNMYRLTMKVCVYRLTLTLFICIIDHLSTNEDERERVRERGGKSAHEKEKERTETITEVSHFLPSNLLVTCQYDTFYRSITLVAHRSNPMYYTFLLIHRSIVV
jgi:hypothetical protein